jgi:hypothetical protein
VEGSSDKENQDTRQFLKKLTPGKNLVCVSFKLFMRCLVDPSASKTLQNIPTLTLNEKTLSQCMPRVSAGDCDANKWHALRAISMGTKQIVWIMLLTEQHTLSKARGAAKTPN